ncbi:hypothetical protein LQW54_001945 [Pestalotiopsis sp. IQ-011]
MGQVTSKLLGKTPGPTEPFPLESVPVDVLFMITDFLDPVAYMSLAMTCKPFYYLLHNRDKLDDVDRQAFVEQLERDLGAEKWYCHFCHKLHPFQPDWTPTGREMWPDAQRKQNGIISYRTPCRYERLGNVGMTFQRNSCGGRYNYYNLGWHHARLVMNRHLFGSPHGLPLSNLRRCFADPDNRITPSFIQDWSARIIQDELILRGVHIWFVRERPPGPDGRKRGGRPFHRDFYHLCPHIVAAHTTPGPHAGLGVVSQLLLWRTLDFFECRNVLRSCDKCLTDYTVTVKRVNAPKKKKKKTTGSEASTLDRLRSASVRQIRKVLGLGKKDNAGDRNGHDSGIQTPSSTSTSTTNQFDETPQESGWLVTIKTYHQFGKCRSPTDLKWRALTMDPGHITDMLHRDRFLYPEGSVKINWNRGDFTEYWNKFNAMVKSKNGLLDV